MRWQTTTDNCHKVKPTNKLQMLKKVVYLCDAQQKKKKTVTSNENISEFPFSQIMTNCLNKHTTLGCFKIIIIIIHSLLYLTLCWDIMPHNYLFVLIVLFKPKVSWKRKLYILYCFYNNEYSICFNLYEFISSILS